MKHFALPPDRLPRLVWLVMTMIGLALLVWWSIAASETPPFVPTRPCSGGQPVGLECLNGGFGYYCKQYRVVYWCPKDSER